MKKLMVAAAIVSMAAVVNAVTCAWSFNKVVQDPAKGAYNSYMAYLCDASVVSSTDMTAALLKGDVSKLSAEGLVQATVGTVQQGQLPYAKNASITAFGDYTGNTEYDFYTIILNDTTAADATYFLATKDLKVVCPTSGALAMAFGSQDAVAWQAMAVPEPTSALLMLLGMAGLALRRKQA